MGVLRDRIVMKFKIDLWVMLYQLFHSFVLSNNGTRI